MTTTYNPAPSTLAVLTQTTRHAAMIARVADDEATALLANTEATRTSVMHAEVMVTDAHRLATNTLDRLAKRYPAVDDAPYSLRAAWTELRAVDDKLGARELVISSYLQTH